MRPDRRTVVPLGDCLGNTEIGVLLDAPLLINPPDEDLVLTSDQWASLLIARRTAGRAVHFVEVA
ncbi:hypothetical protein [Xanthomonas sp. XNM01]|uniref:hypothetical protein n=1 Tax=Xanthomonas sp. XNM01 TaxID=2769289 RepID=UPI001781B458|nr:hypothetical protein [Xanthomonas sp. XNM01]MBD9368837.1 hypothetical protein [Xanthomonas sp. XNM01]